MARLDDELLGKFGFARIGSGTASPSNGAFARLIAINADVTVGPGCETRHGDTLQDGDVIPVGTEIKATFEAVEVKSGGTLLAIYEREQ
jgi:ribosome-associated protein YbcJ (S4-like RNA binding protein)